MRTLRRLAVSSFGLLALVACDRDAMYEQNTFSQNVYEAYDECDDAEIRFLSAKHNIQTAFDNCGRRGATFQNFSPTPPPPPDAIRSAPPPLPVSGNAG